MLGTALRGAHGVPADPALAVRWLKAASDAGVAEASFTLGQIREAGDAAAPDLQDAVVLYRLAVDQGSAVAEQHLGSLAATGALDGLLAPHRAIPWVVAAAEAGNPAAADWLSQQAAAGLRPAQTAFGLWLLTQEDRSGEISVQAADQFQAAAETGDVEAQHNLGRLYIQGQGVDQDYVMAHKWFNIAAAGGHRDALKMRGVVADLMTPEQVAKAQTAARGFVERPPAALSEETSEGISQ
ncbi:sel1 repeat family protein (plasmid) [Parasedimentitalea marina]|uniref:Sel1 repeat family protein n=1 Tax=Parasedimentitalea marina TaxID=2483033 RepID=A0A3T0N9P0_9RHOB|nr:sel1 repeat family protein [Parasedimentitalea marina]